MSINKQFHIQFSQSPRAITNSQTKYDLSLQGLSERILKPMPLPKRQRSLIKQQLFLKKQQQNTSLNKSNEEFLIKKHSQYQQYNYEMNTQKDLTTSELEKKYQEQVSQSKQLQQEIEIFKNQIFQLESQLSNLKQYINDLKQQIENNNLHQQCLQKQIEYKTQLKRMDEILRQALDENYCSQQKMKEFEKKSQKLLSQANNIKCHIVCKFCCSEIQQAVTLIPCAHTFCNKCITQFKGKCFICKDNNKITASYANDYINDLAEIYQTLESLIKVMIN